MFSADTRILEYKEKRILLNVFNGLWIRVSRKVYESFCFLQRKRDFHLISC